MLLQLLCGNFQRDYEKGEDVERNTLLFAFPFFFFVCLQALRPQKLLYSFSLTSRYLARESNINYKLRFMGYGRQDTEVKKQVDISIIYIHRNGDRLRFK